MRLSPEPVPVGERADLPVEERQPVEKVAHGFSLRFAVMRKDGR